MEFIRKKIPVNFLLKLLTIYICYTKFSIKNLPCRIESLSIKNQITTKNIIDIKQQLEKKTLLTIKNKKTDKLSRNKQLTFLINSEGKIIGYKKIKKHYIQDLKFLIKNNSKLIHSTSFGNINFIQN